MNDTRPAISALTNADAHFYFLPDAVALGDEHADEISGIVKPFGRITFHVVTRTDLPPVHVMLAPNREIDPQKVADACEGIVASIAGLTEAELVAHLGTARPEGEPPRTIVDKHLAGTTQFRVLPSGVDGYSLVLPVASLVAVLEALVLDVSSSPTLELVEPYFEVTTDGIRSLEPDKDYFQVTASEIYFDEVRQIVSIGASAEYIECFDRAITAAKRLLPKPDAHRLAAEHYAFLKER
ncbi:MAG: hypothetical protein WBP59_08355 [Ilumatobacteraceae bacterium]